MSIPGLIAQKVGMTRMIDDAGNMVPVTLLHVNKQVVTKILTNDRDGYDALQVGYFEKSEKNLTKADTHRLRKASVNENVTRFREFRLEAPLEGVEVGSSFSTDVLEGVTAVDIQGLTKGRGFQGAVKRWGAKTGRRTHGSRFHRRPGSLGQRATPGRVYKNKHMPGQMGNKNRTIQNLRVLDVDNENQVIAVHGSVPGHRNGYLVVKPSRKSKKA